MIPGFYTGDARTHLDHDPCTLVPQYGREGALGIVTRQGKSVGVAYPGGFYLNHHLAGLGAL